MEAEGLCLHRALWVDLLSLNLKISVPISTTRTLTGEPDALCGQYGYVASAPKSVTGRAKAQL